MAVASALNQSGGALSETVGKISAQSREVEVKTSGDPSIPKVKFSGNQNILNKYRSFTYNFTLAGLKKSAVNDPNAYRQSALDLVIIKSGGKGTGGISLDVEGVDRKVGEEVTEVREGGRVLTRTVKDITQKDMSGKDLVQGFNKDSPGRFDMFIDSVEIESLMGFSPESNTSLPTAIKFEVFEPYSINGFIEALHVAAVAAGYPSYAQASFVLKMEFVGYPDDDATAFKGPEVIPGSTRYFTFGFTGLDVEVTERGTRYRCAAVPFNEKGFGQPNILKKPIQMAGKTVKEILEDLIKKVNVQVAESDKDSKSPADANKHDIYEIKFPDWSETTGFDYSKENKIAEAKIIELLKDNAVYKFPDPGVATKTDAYQGKGKPSPQEQASQPESVKYAPNGAPVAQFADKANINECISSVIRDSEYIRNILRTIGKEKTLDDFGMLNYFTVRMEVTNLDVIDSVSRKPFQKYTYVVSPYKVHYTRLPNFATQKIDQSKLTSLSLREYNYIYTGKNIDVLNFKLNFNTLFFEAIPNALGNNDSPGARTGAGEGGAVVVKSQGDNVESLQRGENPVPNKMVDSKPTQVQQLGGNAGQILDDPYSVLAKNVHEAVVNSKASMISGDLEILGDPFFLVTGGIGNYNPKPAGRGVTEDGEAAHMFGEVLITINFRNPVDIDPLEKGGRHFFESKKVPFSGVYRVNKAVSRFRDGMFKQHLEILRVPGQLLDTNDKPSNPADVFKTSPDPLDSYVVPTGESSNPSGRPTTANLLAQLGRGLPSPGLPGVLSNFTAATGGLGGKVSGLLNQVSGAVTSGVGKLTGNSQIFGGSIPGGVDQLASGIRLQGSGLINLAQTTLKNAATLGQISNTLEGSFPVTGVSKSLATDIVNKATAAASLISVKGSGIGSGATVSLESASASSMIDQANALASDLISVNPSLPAGVKSLTGIATNLGSNPLSAISGMSSKAASLVNGVGDKIKSLTDGTTTDPTALAGKFGINASQLSGLSNELKSKVLDQASALAKSLPEDVDLSVASAQGLVLDYIPAGKLRNIPAIPPFSTAPAPEPDVQAVASLVQTAPSNPLAGINSSKINLTDVTALGGKVLSASSQLTSIVGKTGSLESAFASAKSIAGSNFNSAQDLSNSVVSKFGSLTKGTSPLDKLMSSKNLLG